MTPLLNLPVVAQSDDTIVHFDADDQSHTIYVQTAPDSLPLPSANRMYELGWDASLTEVVPGVTKAVAGGRYRQAMGGHFRALLGNRPDYPQIITALVHDGQWKQFEEFASFSTVSGIYDHAEAEFELPLDTPVSLRLSDAGDGRVRIHPSRPLTARARRELSKHIDGDGTILVSSSDVARAQVAVVASEQIGDMIAARAARFDSEFIPVGAPKEPHYMQLPFDDGDF